MTVLIVALTMWAVFTLTVTAGLAVIRTYDRGKAVVGTE